MFLSRERISFVFANEKDTYFGDDLLKLDLNQYLWKQLHANYKTVFFLSIEKEEPGMFGITSFGDWNCKPYTSQKKKRLFSGSKTEQREQGKWILQQLEKSSREAVAFVCPLADFCDVLSDQNWDSTLEAIAKSRKITGKFVLTAPAVAEESAKLLLTSPVFGKLREDAITGLRTDTELELYSALKKWKGDDCQFLNRFTWDRIRAVLLHVVMEYPSRLKSMDHLDQMANYLSAYLRDPEMAEKDRLPLGNLPTEYYTYEKLYERLRGKEVWEKLAQCSASNTEHLCLERWEDAGDHVPVLRDLTSYAGRCMRLNLPKAVLEDERSGARAREMLRTIRSKVSTPKNQLENAEIAAYAEGFLNHLDGMSGHNVESYLWALRALVFCVNQVYLPVKSPQWDAVKANMDVYKMAIEASVAIARLQSNLEVYKLCDNKDGGTAEIGRQQIEMQIFAHRERCRQCDELVTRMEAGLQATGVSNTEHMSEIVKTLVNYLNSQTSVPEKVDTWIPELMSESKLKLEHEAETMDIEDKYEEDDDEEDDLAIIKPPSY